VIWILIVVAVLIAALPSDGRAANPLCPSLAGQSAKFLDGRLRAVDLSDLKIAALAAYCPEPEAERLWCRSCARGGALSEVLSWFVTVIRQVFLVCSSDSSRVSLRLLHGPLAVPCEINPLQPSLLGRS
jgi:hypothetical protein